MSLEDFYAEAQKYIPLFDAFATKHSLMGSVQSDHICYKCGSKESFESLRTLFEHEGVYIYQSIISNRRIAIIKFKQGIETVLGTINFLELSDQKPDGSQKDGFDHIEAYPMGVTYEEMISKLEASEKVLKVERPHHTTYDIELEGGFVFRCTRGPLIEKIRTTEMT